MTKWPKVTEQNREQSNMERNEKWTYDSYGYSNTKT